MTKINKTIIYPVILAFLLTLAGLSFAGSEIAPAGVEIKGVARADFNKGESFSNPVLTIVPQIYGITLSPLNLYANMKKGEAYYFPHHVENVGNGTDVVSLKAEGAPKGFRVRFIKDEDGNGIHERSEKEVIKDSLKLSEGAKGFFFIELTALENMGVGSTCDIAVRLQSSGSDGPAYLGSNGNIYGGSDVVTTKDRILVL